VWHEFDDAAYWAAREVAPAFPIATVAPAVLAGNVPIREPADVITRPETVVAFGGRPIGPTGGLTAPTRLHRTGPHGALARTELSAPSAPSAPSARS
jgi:hypothetical protein